MSKDEHKQRKKAMQDTARAIQYAINVASKNKPTDRSPLARVFAVAITLLEQANAYISFYGNQEANPAPLLVISASGKRSLRKNRNRQRNWGLV